MIELLYIPQIRFALTFVGLGGWIILNAFLDSEQIKRGHYIYHPNEVVKWGLIYGLSILLMQCRGVIEPRHVLYTILILPFVRWIFHDLLLNIFRGLPWDYRSKPNEKGKHRSWTDKIQDDFQIKYKAHSITLKLGLLSLSIVAVLLIELVYEKI